MMHRKLLDILKLLAAKGDLPRLEKFLNSPYFTESSQMIHLFEYLIAFAPDFNDEQLSGEYAFDKLFPNEDFDREKLNRKTSNLYQLVQEFLAIERLQNQPFEKDRMLLKYFDEEFLDSHFESTLKRVRKQEAAQNWKDIAYYQRQLELELLLYQYKSKRDDRKGDVNLQAVNNSLDDYFLLQKLILLNLMEGRRQITQVTYDLTWRDTLLTYLSDEANTTAPIIQLYKQVLLMYQAPEQHYFQLKALLHSHFDELSAEENRVFLAYLKNNVKHVFQGEIEHYYKELFSLYEWQTAKGLLHYKGHIQHSEFKNVVTIALNLKKFDWARDFIEENQGQIFPEKYQADAYVLNKANLLYAQGSYSESRALLLPLNPKDIYYKLSAKSLLARIYYECKDLELLENFLNSFKKHIWDQRLKISKDKISSYNLFIKYFRKVLNKVQSADVFEAFENDEKLKRKKAIKSFEKIKQQITKESVFYGKKWLLEKIDNLIA
jgi:hypothetical protein